jgi:hypothetical protein
MNKGSLMRSFAASASCILCCLISSAGGAETMAALVPDPRREMISVLPAMGPHASLGDQASVFGRFVGTWDADYTKIGDDGKISHTAGEIILGWIMDGHALQDLFIVYPNPPGEKRIVGTTLRYFDDKSGKWRVTYIEPASDSVITMTGGQEGSRIVLHGEGRQSSLIRWSFNDIKDNSFTWRGERSLDGGKTWRLEDEYFMKRRTASATDSRRDMVSALHAMGPHPSLGDQANVFGRFVGTWDADYTEFMDGKAIHSSGELVLGWIMEGHAVQDLFISDPTGLGKEREMGTTLRYFDDKLGKWRVTYIEPGSDSVVKLTGGQEGSRIVLYGEGRQSHLLRWSFNDIKDNSFTWRGEVSYDGGKTWKLKEEHRFKRRVTAGLQ